MHQARQFDVTFQQAKRPEIWHANHYTDEPFAVLSLPPYPIINGLVSSGWLFCFHKPFVKKCREMSEPFLSLHKKGREDLQQQYSLQQNQVLIAPSYIAAKVFWGADDNGVGSAWKTEKESSLFSRFRTTEMSKNSHITSAYSASNCLSFPPTHSKNGIQLLRTQFAGIILQILATR